MQVLDYHDDGLDSRLAEEEPLDAVQRLPATLLRVEPQPPGVVSRDVEQPQECRYVWLEPCVEQKHLSGDFFGDLMGLVLGLDLEILPEQLGDRQEGGRLSMRDAAAFQDQAAVVSVRVEKLPVESRLSDSSVRDHAKDLSVTVTCAVQGGLELGEFHRPSDELRQTAGGSSL